MKEYFYYLRDELRRPVVTVCLLKSDRAVIARGVSICSRSDNPCRKTGKAIAKGRALKAFVNTESGGLVTRAEAKDVLNEIVPSFWLGSDLMEKGKYVFGPVLSIEERNLTKDWIPMVNGAER